VLAEYGLCWQNMIYTGRKSLLPAEYDFYWQNMIYTGLLSLLLAEYAANQKCSAILLCSADSIYPAQQPCTTIPAPLGTGKEKCAETYKK